MTRRVIIAGAAGRDFHNFNVRFRGDTSHEVVAFTAAQIPHIEQRVYPAELAGPRYPDGIPIYSEERIAELIAELGADDVVFAYSDVPNAHVMDLAGRAVAAGASFQMLGLRDTWLPSRKPVVAVTAARTGCGKSPLTRAIVKHLRDRALRVAVVRHPMPYGDLERQIIQRFEKPEDLDKHECTIEEREEYESHIERGSVVYAGVDYERILRQAEIEADVILWDGGNNDFPFYEPSLWFALVDPHRAGHETQYWPGAVNVRRADVILITKVDTAGEEQTDAARRSARRMNPTARILEAASPISVDDPSVIEGKRVLVIEDGPTTTHGGMSFGAGTLAARRFGAAELIDPRRCAVGELAETLKRYDHITEFVPAMGYAPSQIAELEETIRRSEAQGVVIGTPVNLARIVSIDAPATRVRYEMQLLGHPTLGELLDQVLEGESTP